MIKKTILLLCFGLVTWAAHSSNALMSSHDETPILIVSATNNSGVIRTNAILASINCHTLTVAFTEYLGNVTIEVTDAMGSPVDLTLVGTPTGYECYIPLTGHYTVYFKLANGDEYSGEFDVTD